MSDINLLDGNWINTAADWARRASKENLKFNFKAMQDLFVHIRASSELPPSSKSVITLALDLDNAGQSKLADAVRACGIYPNKTDYRHAYVSNTETGKDISRPAPMPMSLAHWMTYMMGLIAGQGGEPTLVLVTGAFEVVGPIREMVIERKAKVVVAYFSRMMDSRYKETGVFRDNKIKGFDFFDLEPYSKDLLGFEFRKQHEGENLDLVLPI